MAFGRHAIPLWLIVVVMASTIGLSVMAYVLSTSFTATLQVKEPLSIVNYPSQFSLFPGETANFSVTVTNSAPVNYSVVLDCKLNDSEYQTSYVSFSNDVYNVSYGQQNLNAWMRVSTDAPAATLTVSVNLERLGPGETGARALTPYLSDDFESFPAGWTVYRDVSGGSGIVTRSNTQYHSGSYSAEFYVPTAFDSACVSRSFSSTPTGDFHYSIWVYIDGSVIPDQYGLYVGRLGSLNDPTHDNLWISIGYVSGAFYLRNWRSDFAFPPHPPPILENVCTLTTGVWHHVEAYYLSSSGKVHYYVDGVRQGGDWTPLGTNEPSEVNLGDTYGTYYLSGLMYFDDVVVEPLEH